MTAKPFLLWYQKREGRRGEGREGEGRGEERRRGGEKKRGERGEEGGERSKKDFFPNSNNNLIESEYYIFFRFLKWTFLVLFCFFLFLSFFIFFRLLLNYYCPLFFLFYFYSLPSVCLVLFRNLISCNHSSVSLVVLCYYLKVD